MRIQLFVEALCIARTELPPIFSLSALISRPSDYIRWSQKKYIGIIQFSPNLSHKLKNNSIVC
jgi:hypothetical protein